MTEDQKNCFNELDENATENAEIWWIFFNNLFEIYICEIYSLDCTRLELKKNEIYGNINSWLDGDLPEF